MIPNTLPVYNVYDIKCAYCPLCIYSTPYSRLHSYSTYRVPFV